jgi:hypothetical protein
MAIHLVGFFVTCANAVLSLRLGDGYTMIAWICASLFAWSAHKLAMEKKEQNNG